MWELNFSGVVAPIDHASVNVGVEALNKRTIGAFEKLLALSFFKVCKHDGIYIWRLEFSYQSAVWAGRDIRASDCLPRVRYDAAPSGYG